jgi:hypothetical protein
MRKLIVIFCLGFSFTKINAQQIDARIVEVFKDAEAGYMESDPVRIDFLTDLLQNRIRIIESPINSKENYTKLSEVPLLNKYNSALTRDVVFDPLTFNPLKYNFEFSSITEAKAYRVDNTAYIIVINPQTTKK